MHSCYPTKVYEPTQVLEVITWVLDPKIIKVGKFGPEKNKPGSNYPFFYKFIMFYKTEDRE